MTRGQKEVLLDIKRGCTKGFFDAYPHKRTIAKHLMWRDYIKGKGQCLFLTSTGRAALKEAETHK